MSNQDLIKKLKETKLYNEILRNDVVKGEVFLAFRNNRIDFYYEGGKLFSFDHKGFSTHIKYASVIDTSDGKDDSIENYVTEEKLENYKLVSNFLKGIARIKENCKNYAGDEAKGVAEIYSKYSYLKSNKDIVVLDIEIAFEAKDRKGHDRIDILLLDKKNKNLIFVEAKHSLNKDLWSTTTPEVIKQINRYEQQIKMKEGAIKTKYCENIKLLNDLFEIELPFPEKIDDKVILFIFGFDDDKKKGKLKRDVYEKKEYKGKMIYSKGDVSNIILGELIKSKNLNI